MSLYTWPHFNDVSRGGDTSSKVLPLDPSFVPDPGLPEKIRKDLEDTFYLSSPAEVLVFSTLNGLNLLHAFSSSVLQLETVTVPDSLPILEPSAVVLRDASVDEDDEYDEDGNLILDEVNAGPHAHTLFLTHRVNLRVLSELRPLISDAEAGAVPVMVLVNYKVGDTIVATSRYLGNLVQYLNSVHRTFGTPAQLVMTQALQCYAVSVLGAPMSPDVGKEYRHLALMGALYAEACAQYEDDEDDEDDGEDFDDA